MTVWGFRGREGGGGLGEEAWRGAQVLSIRAGSKGSLARAGLGGEFGGRGGEVIICRASSMVHKRPKGGSLGWGGGWDWGRGTGAVGQVALVRGGWRRWVVGSGSREGGGGVRRGELPSATPALSLRTRSERSEWVRVRV